MRELTLALLLAASAAAVISGVAQFSPRGAWIVGGLLFAGLSWLFLGEVE